MSIAGRFADIRNKGKFAGITHAGNSARWEPGESRQYSINRRQNLRDLKKKFTPSANPVQELVDRATSLPFVHPSDIPVAVASGSMTPQSVIDSSISPDLARQLPSGDMTLYNQLKSKAQAGAIPVPASFQNDPGATSLPVVVREQLPGRSFSNTGHRYVVESDGASPLLSSRPLEETPTVITTIQSPLAQTKSLSRGLGNYAMGHDDEAVRWAGAADTPVHWDNADAEAIAYGVVNRAYPWSKANLDDSAKNLISGDIAAGQALSRDPSNEDLSISGVDKIKASQALLNQAIANIAVDRKPFSRVFANQAPHEVDGEMVRRI